MSRFGPYLVAIQAAALVAIAPRLACGQSLDAEPVVDANEEVIDVNANQEVIDVDEEVTVVGRRNYYSMVRESAALTESFYMRLNAVIQEPDFKVSCDTVRREYSTIRTRECKTNFHRRMWNISTASILRNIVPNRDGMKLFGRWTGVIEPVEAASLAHAADFEAAILDAINRDPVLNQQYHRLRELKIAIDDYRMLRDRNGRAAE